MQVEQFIERVNQQAPGQDEQTARRATFAVIAALCEHLSAEETRRMASQLPTALAEAAETGGEQKRDSADGTTLQAFYERIASRAELSDDKAKSYTQAVAGALQESVSRGELVDVTFELPPALKALFAS